MTKNPKGTSDKPVPMYDVRITFESTLVAPKHSEEVMPIWELHQHIGRLSIKFGPALDISHGTTNGVTMYEFSRILPNGGEETLTMRFWRMMEGGAKTETHEPKVTVLKPTEEKPTTPPPPVVQPKKVQDLLDLKAIEKTYEYRGHNYGY